MPENPIDRFLHVSIVDLSPQVSTAHCFSTRISLPTPADRLVVASNQMDRTSAHLSTDLLFAPHLFSDLEKLRSRAPLQTR